jgi:LysM repeat protein
VALAEDRDRRADTPDEGNRCYAERAPRRRDLSYQSDYCYSADFARCSVFLEWAARNAAQPAFVTEAAQRAWASGAAEPTGPDAASGETHADPGDAAETGTMPRPTPERGLFGMSEPAAPDDVRSGEQLDWVSASAWAEAPWDESAEPADDELDELDELLDEEGEPEEALEVEPEVEATQAPKVPAALPLRRRKAPQEPIRSRGSGEWLYADPPGRQPLVSRRYGVVPPVLLVVLGILIVSVVAFLIAAQMGGDASRAAAASPSPASTARAGPTRAPTQTAEPSNGPEQTTEPRARFYRVRAGDSLTGIAARFDVRVQHLQCINTILDRNIIVLGQRLEIPPEGYSCPSGWRRATPEP